MLHSPSASEMGASLSLSLGFFIPPSPSGGNKQEETRGGKKKKSALSLGKKMRVAPDDVDFDTC